MKIENQAFYSGPNVWHTSSGVLLILSLDASDRDRFDWKPTTEQAGAMLTRICHAMRVVDESSGLTRPERLVQSPVPLLALMVATTRYLIDDRCLQPQPARVFARQSGRMRVFQPCDDAAVGAAAWQLAMEAAQLLLPIDKTPPGAGKLLRERYWHYRRTVREHGLNQTTITLAREALRRGIPVQRLAAASQFVQLGQGCHLQRINETDTDRGSSLARWLSKDKFATATILGANGVPTPQPTVVGSADEAVRAWRALNQPVVVKPRSSSKGLGVTVGAGTEEAVRAAYKVAVAAKGSGVIVERVIHGHDYRLLVVDGKLVAAGKRVPAHVIGDGKQSVEDLIAALNLDPRRGLPFERLMELVSIDDEARLHIEAAGLTLQGVPQAGRVVMLRGAANMSRGGTAQDVTPLVHPDNSTMIERAARLVGVDITGIDFMSPDIGQSWRKTGGAILEVNGVPGLRVHMASNPAQNVAAPMLDYLFPGGADGRIPTAGITGSVGKTTTTRLVAAILAQHGLAVGICTTQGTFVDGYRVKDRDSAGGTSANKLMQDPSVQAGAFEFARGGLVKFGMALDHIDVGAVLNIHDNHLGIDGVKTREDLATVKRLVVQNARKLAVLNADEPLCLAMREHIRAPVCLFTEDAANPEVAGHIAAGGLAAVLVGRGRAAVIRLVQGTGVIGELAATDLPASWGGSYRPALVTAMVAAALAHGLGVPFATIRTALTSFQSERRSNPGRMNFIEGLPFRFLLTWSDGAESIRELSQFVKSLPVKGRKRLMYCAVGNRSDDFLMAMGGAAAGAFDQYICSDWEDRRGREPGAVAQLLARGLDRAGVARDAIHVTAEHEEALRMAFDSSQEGDLLVVASFISAQAQSKINALANIEL
ncbi:Mur ligase family protein [Caenimonas sp. SL110]|uniref:Mur ligase family protein n=1 Tax=Caenimonas sp. SL110 TaxID=1450524 RepID=UPI00069FB99F|nr:Mur ligase family protein [Caenimonas sp. SL110]